MKYILMGSLLAISAIGFVGCKTFGGGITNREFDTHWAALEIGQTTATVESLFGSPREKNPAEADLPGHTQWIYSRPEVIGHRTEIEEVFRSKDGASVPVVEEVEVLGNVEFHLYFHEDKLTHWERIVPRHRRF